MKEELLKDLKDAMKNKDEIKKNAITMLRAAILQYEKDNLITLNDEEIAGIVAKEVKKRKDAIEEYKKAERQDIIDELNQEIEVLSKYLPKQLTEAEITSLVEESIQIVGATSPRDIGKVMQDLKPKTTGKADGKLVSDIVKAKLSNL